MAEVGYVLQWNMGCPHAPGAQPRDPKLVLQRCKLIQDAIELHTPTFVVLQEVPKECLNLFRRTMPRKYQVLKGTSGLVTLYDSKSWQLSSSNPVNVDRGMLAPLVHLRTKVRIRLWNVHLRSDMNTKTEEKEDLARLFCDIGLRKNRSTPSSDYSTELIAGDFNMDPLASPMTTKTGFWTNSSLHEATRADRSARRNPALERYRALFNPMHSVRGRPQPPQGTLYRASSSGLGPWYTYDQTVMSPEHGLEGPESQVKVLEKIGTVRLWSNAKLRLPDDKIGSDHYPVLVKFKLP